MSQNNDKVAQYKLTWQYAWPYFKPYKGMLWVVLILSVMASAADPGLAGLASPFTEFFVLNPEKGREILWLVPVGIIVIFAWRGIFNFSSKYLLERLCIRVVRDMQVALYKHFMYLSLDHYERTTTGKMMSRTVNDVSRMNRVVPMSIDVLHNVFTLIFLAGVCFYQDPKLSAFAILAIPATVYPVQRISTAMKSYTKKGLSQVAEINSTMQETYSGAKVVKAFAMEDREVDKYADETNSLLKINFKFAAVKHMISPLIGFIAAFAIAPIAYYLVYNIDPELLSNDEAMREFFTKVSSFLIALALMYTPVRKLGTTAGQFTAAYGAMERIRETFERTSTVTEDEEAVEIPNMRESIVYEGVNFKYDKDYVLRDFNLEIKAGELVALVGESGSGKSTVVNLLPRFYDIQEGSIKIDGLDIRRATLRSLRMQIGVVTQETFLFNLTVAQNILYGSEGKGMDHVMAAAKVANAHDFITQLPKGYDTVIGERGVRLSGGEKQRLAIARALLKDPPILVLDEATSALDTTSEREVQKALDSLMRDRTTIAIAHRLSTIRHADKIVVIKDGRVVEQGTHVQLMGQDGEYRRLYEMQFFLGKHAVDHYADKEPDNGGLELEEEAQ